MYAVIRTGGKQYKVKVGDVIDVERLAGDDGASLELEPLLVVDDDGNVTSTSADLEKATMGVGRSAFSAQGQKCSACSRVYAHRQSLTRLKVETIDLPGRKRPAKAATRAKRAPKQEPKQDEKQDQKQDQEG